MEEKKSQTWLKLSRLQLPSSVKFGLNEKVTHGNMDAKEEKHE